MDHYESFDDWYEDNKEGLSTYTFVSALRNTWNAARATIPDTKPKPKPNKIDFSD